MGLAAQAIMLADQAFVFDNSHTGSDDSAPRLVLRSKYDRTKDKLWWNEIPPTPRGLPDTFRAG